MPASLRRPLAALLLVTAVLVAHRGVLDLAMMGWDGWPLAAAARIESLGDFFGTFGERLMDGRYPHGDFYRPVTHLVFAFDEALSGLDPRGYHRTDLALLALDTLLVAAVVTRLAGGWAGLVAGLVFGLHPLQLELLPVPARRADALALGFALACLLTQTTDRASRGRALAIGGLAFLAAASKETGAFVVPAVFGWHLALGRGAGVAGALRRSVPAFVGVALYVALRTVVLGGLGGHTGELGPSVSTGELWRGLAAGVLYPEPLVGAGSGALLAALGLALVAAVVIVLRSAPETRRPLAALGLLALSILALTSLADRLHTWYAVLLAAPYAGVLGVLVASSAKRLRSGAASVVACAIGATLALSHLLASPLFREYPLLENSSAWLDQSYDLLEREVEQASEGQVVRINPWPIGVPPRADGRDVQSLALAHGYTAAAFLELRFPDLDVEVTMFDGARPSPQPGVLRIQLVPSAPPGWVTETR